MLQIEVVLVPELWDDEKEMFIEPVTTKIQLEHSLLSIHKWESKWHKAFLGKQEKTFEETLDYIRCMTLTQNVKPEVYDKLTQNNIDEIYAYINNPMTATTFRENQNQRGNKETITAELIYYWMITLNIPWDCRKWHLNQLLTLVRVCNVKNEPPKKRSRNELYKHHAAVNAARRKKH